MHVSMNIKVTAFISEGICFEYLQRHHLLRLSFRRLLQTHSVGIPMEIQLRRGICFDAWTFLSTETYITPAG
jgi:hypothetical protein